ncbi:asparagine synthase-related protein [Gemmatimonadota bacterium]
MPGIFGVVSNKYVKQSLQGMAGSMFLYDHFKQDEMFCDADVGGSRAHTGQVGEASSPARLDSHLMWIEGEAYNVSEVAKELNLQAATLSELLLRAEREGKLNKCLNRLDGYFCAALYDSAQKKIKLISDRYGMRLLYWYHKDSVFAWGSEVKAILAVEGVDKKLDPTSFDCFMDLGYLMGEHTWFDHIKLIKPATVIEYDIRADEAHQYHYWMWSEIKPSNMSFDEAVDELGERFIEAVSRRFGPNERIGISLSGGLDSRAIFAAVDHLYPDYIGYAYTFGIPGCDDITIAEQVIARSEWRHEIFHFSKDNWFEPRIQKVWDTDGMLDMMHMHGSEFLDEISKHMDVNLNGYCGDVILGGGFLSKVPWNQRITESNSKTVYGRFSNFADIDSAFYNIQHVEPNLYTNRFRRFTNYGSVNSLPWVDQRKPFFDNKLVEFAFSIPDKYRSNNRLYSTMLQKLFPKYFRNIPWQKTGKPAGVMRKASIPAHAVRKGVRIFKHLVNMQSTEGYTDYPTWIRDEEVADKLTNLLHQDAAQYRMLTEDDLAKRWLQPHLKSRVVNHSNQILRVATIEIYLRKIFGETV